MLTGSQDQSRDTPRSRGNIIDKNSLECRSRDESLRMEILPGQFIQFLTIVDLCLLILYNFQISFSVAFLEVSKPSHTQTNHTTTTRRFQTHLPAYSQIFLRHRPLPPPIPNIHHAHTRLKRHKAPQNKPYPRRVCYHILPHLPRHVFRHAPVHFAYLCCELLELLGVITRFELFFEGA